MRNANGERDSRNDIRPRRTLREPGSDGQEPRYSPIQWHPSSLNESVPLRNEVPLVYCRLIVIAPLVGSFWQFHFRMWSFLVRNQAQKM